MQMEEKIRKLLIFVLEIFAMAMLYMLLSSAGIYKYIVVGTVCLLICVINYQKIDSALAEGYLFIPVLLYCGMGGALSLCGGTMTLWTVKNFAFWIFPVIVSLSLRTIYEDDRRHMIDIQFCGCVMAYVLPIIEWLLFGGGLAESIYAFPLGVFFIYYMWRHEWLKVCVIAMLLYFSNKRIAILAVVLSVALMLFMRCVAYSKKWIKIIWGLLCGVACFYVYSISSGLFEQICYRFGINTTYRLDVYTQLSEHIPKNYFLGEGIGTANKMIYEFVDPGLIWAFENPHNDLLKLFLELGSIGLVMFMISYFVVFKIAEKKITQRALSQLFVIFVYFVLLMTTDNVSIYILFLVPMHSICLALLGEKKENEDEYHAK